MEYPIQMYAKSNSGHAQHVISGMADAICRTNIPMMGSIEAPKASIILITCT
jgi:hypothetical protein